MSAVSDDILERVENLEDLASSTKARRDMLEEREGEISREIEELEAESDVLEKAEEGYKYLLDKMIYQYADSFSSVTTEGLENIFPDQNLSFRIDVDRKYDKVWLDFVTIDDGLEGNVLDAFGGGVAAVESVFLRILVLLRSDLARYLFLDEALASLSEKYVPAFGEFLQSMCDDLDVDILLITHNQSFLDYADRAYRATQEKRADEPDAIDVREITGGVE